MARGTLRIYLGAAPGVGKTYALLNEARRRRDRGADVVIGYVETHGRAHTAAQIGDLEVIPRRTIEHRGTTFEEMDLDAVLARHPQVVLVDELAHTNVPGSRNAKRYQDVKELLDAGIDVVSTVNIQHLESINDVVERITGITQQETIPDEIVRSAEQVELIDMTPEALRRRMAHGNIYAPERIDAALTNYFREGNLTALRELALLWVADQVDVALEDYRERHGITAPWETRERVVVAITGAPSTDALIRRASRIARHTHGDLVGVHVRSQQGLAGPSTGLLSSHRQLLEEVGGEYHETAGSDIAAALIEYARAENATQIMLGSSHQSRWQEVVRGSIINRVVRLSGSIDVHVVSDESQPERAALPRMPRRRGLALPPRRVAIGWALNALGLPLMTWALAHTRDGVGPPTVIVLYLLWVVIASAIGGLAPALAAALVGFLAVDWYFTPPLHTLSIGHGENAVSLAAYLLTAVIVSGLVAIAARRHAEANRASAEAQTLSALASSVVEVDPLPALMAHLRRAFGLTGAALLRRTEGGWAVEAADGNSVSSPDDGDTVQSAGDELVLVLSGRALDAEDTRVLHAFAANLSAALDRRHLHHQAAHAAALAKADALRSALLQAVSHDLRTPLAGIKASVSSLRQTDVAWNETETAEFLKTIEDETDRLNNLIDNLLDMSRIHAGVVSPLVQSVTVDEVVSAAMASLGPRSQGVVVELDDDLPPVDTDPVLLERVVANLVDNAVTHGSSSCPVHVDAGVAGGRVLLRVIDRGRGVPPDRRDQMFHPFQRLDDTQPRGGAGVGLGLAVARGFTRAMGGELTVEDTPGGGTTMVIDLEASM